MTVSEWVSLLASIHWSAPICLSYISFSHAIWHENFWRDRKTILDLYEYLERRIWQYAGVLSHVRLLLRPVDCRPAPLSMEPPRQEHWVGCHPCSGAPADPGGRICVSCLLHWRQLLHHQRHLGAQAVEHIDKWLLGKWKKAESFFTKVWPPR